MRNSGLRDRHARTRCGWTPTKRGAATSLRRGDTFGSPGVRRPYFTRRGTNVKGPRNGAPQSRKEYRQPVGGQRFSLMVRGEIQRVRFSGLPALSLVPLPLAPPNGC